ncbi:MAG: serine/threonine protein kinase [Planctomycetes bacterium]|nr:serine/threonine protein kinase [Planctomycetota bacterium]
MTPDPLADTFHQRLDPARLRVLSTLGEGANGKVHLAEDRLTGRRLALKLLRDVSPRALERFRREAELAASLRHDNVVPVHFTGLLEGRPCVAYEVVEGARTLDEASRGAPLARRVELLRDAARGLGHAHARGVVHRDVKPDNVLVGADGRARVTDFGVGITDEHERLTRTGMMAGTPRYMAPEQLGARVRPTPALDVWALGVLLYQALTDRLPFDGETLMALSDQIAAARPTPPSRLAGVPPALEALCLSALHKDPARRPADGAAFARALDDWLAAPAAPGAPPRRRRAAVAACAVAAAGLLAGWALAPSARPAPGAVAGEPEAPAASTPAPAAAAPALPDWRATLGGPARWRLTYRDLTGGDDILLELTLLQEAPEVRGDVARITATFARVRFSLKIKLTQVEYDSLDGPPGGTPVAGIAPGVAEFLDAFLAARVRFELDLRTGAARAVEGLPRPTTSAFDDGFATHVVRHLQGQMQDSAFAGYLDNVLHLFPADPAQELRADLWRAPPYYLLRAPRQVRWSPEEGRVRTRLAGHARGYLIYDGRPIEFTIERAAVEGEAHVEGDRITRSRLAVAYDGLLGDATARHEATFTFELLAPEGP